MQVTLLCIYYAAACIVQLLLSAFMKLSAVAFPPFSAVVSKAKQG